MQRPDLIFIFRAGLVLFASGWLYSGSTSAVAQSVPAIWIRLNESREIEINFDDSDALREKKPARGLIVWRNFSGRDRWFLPKPGGQWPDLNAVATETRLPLGASRNVSNTVGGGTEQSLLAATIQLDALGSGATLTRGAGFISPAQQGEILSGQPTIRRLPESKTDVQFPEKVAVLYAGTTKREVLRIPFSKGQAQVAFREIANIPKELANGLAPGAYTLRFLDGLESTTFTVATAVQHDRVLQPVTEMEQLSGSRTNPLALQFGVEWLLSYEDSEGTPLYLSDALDLLESAPAAALTPVLVAKKADLCRWLEFLARDPGYRQGAVSGVVTGGSTGVDGVDEARRLIASGEWSQAEKLLMQIKVPAEPAQARRVRGLVQLYRGVIQSEAGAGKADQAVELFRSALSEFDEGQPSDRFRAHNNFANFLLQQAQDRVDNHAFQIAAGVDSPVFSALQNWMESLENYQSALTLAVQLKDEFEQAAVELNLSRLYALLADVIKTLDPPVDGRRQLLPEDQSASQQADRFAQAALARTKAPGPGLLIVGAAHEIRARLAYRGQNLPESSRSAELAEAAYLQSGYLAGVESIQRLQGLNRLAAGKPQEALKHLKISHHLAEVLRQRFPQDHVGLTRAGFFSRRSFVYEKIVELLIADGKPGEALRFAELSKARAAQDILAAGGIASEQTADPDGTFPELLAHWPKDVAALEYFLGADNAWVFLIAPGGKVSAHRLCQPDGQPVASRDLIGEVRSFLSEIEGHSAKMSERILNGKGFDHAWQDQLFAFRKILLPDTVLDELRKATTVVVAAQHILHYFPFAALVTERDERDRKPLEMVSPKFLVDEPFHLISSPSLTVWGLLRRQPVARATQASAIGIVEVPGAPPLPGVQLDLDNFKGVFGNRVRKIYEGDEAREENARLVLAQSGVLLLATHGSNNADHPLDSYLLFLPNKDDAPGDAPEPDSQGDVNDGRLSAREIYSRRVNASLVVMSACYSGLGDRSPLPGDDLFGLQRAFLDSGARAVVSGYWDVYDATAPSLIEGFFSRYSQGLAPSLALAESQRAFLKSLRQSPKAEPFIHPYFWAVYSVAGEDGADARN